VLGKTFDQCNRSIHRTSDIFKSFGFMINTKKSQLTPSNVQTYLGFSFDSLRMSMTLPQEKKDNILSLIQGFLRKSSPKMINVARPTGTLVAAAPAVSGHSYLYTKALESGKVLALTNSRGNFDAPIQLSEEALDDLCWWQWILPNSFNLVRQDTFDFCLTTDASPTGWGAHVLDKVTRGFWSKEEQTLHINTLEIIAVFMDRSLYYPAKAIARYL